MMDPKFEDQPYEDEKARINWWIQNEDAMVVVAELAAQAIRTRLLEALLSDLEDEAFEGGDTWALERIQAVLGPVEERIPRP